MTCPHIITSDEGPQYCGLAERAVRERDAEIVRLHAVIDQIGHRLDICQTERDRLAAENEKLREALELTYGLLWSTAIMPGDIQQMPNTWPAHVTASAARKVLLALLDREGQSRGICAARAALAKGE